nr:hypothetical protein [Tanacetum cinerariifolium]
MVDCDHCSFWFTKQTTTSPKISLSQLYRLELLELDGCKKLEVLPELPPSLRGIHASDCASLREVLGSSKAQLPPSLRGIHASDCASLREVLGSSKARTYNYFLDCPNLFKNVNVDREGSISKTQCLDSSIITSQGSIHQLAAFLGLLGFQTNRCEFFSQDIGYSDLDIVYHGNRMPEWFTNKSRENHVKVELPSADWCYDKNFRGFGTCVVFKCKKPFNRFNGYSVNNFDGASLKRPDYFSLIGAFLKKEVIGIYDVIWLHYRKVKTGAWKEAKNFVTFSFFEEFNNEEDVEVKECGIRLICVEEIQEEAHLSMLHGLPIPSQHGGMLGLRGPINHSLWPIKPCNNLNLNFATHQTRTIMKLS